MRPAPFGIDALLGLGAALSWVVASAFRCGGFSLTWLLSGWGVAALFFVPFVIVLRRAHVGVHGISTEIYGALLGALPWTVIGALLMEKTHHRALGAVTFAFLAVGTWGLGTAIAGRLQHEHRRTGRSFPHIVLKVSAAFSVVATVVVAAKSARVAALSPIAMEAFIGCVLALAAIRAPRVESPRWLSLAGVLTWALVVTAGILSSRVNPPFDAVCSPLASKLDSRFFR